MAVSPFDSALHRDLFGDREIGALFADAAEIRAVLLFEGALAAAQGRLGLIPEDSAAAIVRASREVSIDPAALAEGTAAAGLSIPALIPAFRAAMGAPEHAAWVHFGATSQDALDTGLVLRLRRALDLIDARTAAIARALGDAAARHRALPMAARTRGQIATPTTFGARIAAWGWPLLRARDRLAELRPRLLVLSLGGASGTLAALGPRGWDVARETADELGLGLPEGPWHSARDGLAECASTLTLLTGALGKFGRDLILLGQTEVGELRAGAGGGSSTMPHKSNPVGPETLVALARLTARLSGGMADALVHEHERDGAAWALEWLCLPQICAAAGGATRIALDLAGDLRPDGARMAANMAATGGLMMAEAATFALARRMPRPEAQALVEAACARAAAEGRTLAEALSAAADPALGLDWEAELDPARNAGIAPELADRFAAAARA